jgi:hypothetical protein
VSFTKRVKGLWRGAVRRFDAKLALKHVHAIADIFELVRILGFGEFFAEGVRKVSFKRRSTFGRKTSTSSRQPTCGSWARAGRNASRPSGRKPPIW